MKTPNKERIQLWAEALESGEFRQGTECLVSIVDGAMRHCCLGVAARVAFRNGVEPPPDGKYATWFDDACMPIQVAEWFGLSPNPLIGSGQPQNSTATWCNDELRMSFVEIAAAIRHTYLDEEKEGKRT